MAITDDRKVELLADDIVDRFVELVTVPVNEFEQSQKRNAAADLFAALLEVIDKHQQKVESGHYHNKNVKWLEEVNAETEAREARLKEALGGRNVEG